MLQINIQIDKRDLKGLEKFPGLVRRHIDLAASRTAVEAANMIKETSPKATSQLADSVQLAKLGSGRYRVGPTVNYAEAVERGSKPGGFPWSLSILDWVKRKNIQPRVEGMTQRDLGFVIARSIFHRGIKAQPFVEPVKDKMQSRLHELMQLELQEALNKVTSL